jgi:hypothetical protein
MKLAAVVSREQSSLVVKQKYYVLERISEAVFVPKCHGVFLVDTDFFKKMGGIYTIEDCTVTPCLRTIEKQHKPCSNFALEFDFPGLDEKGSSKPSEQARRGFANMNRGAQRAKDFVAWLVVATNQWMRLSSESFGHAGSAGPMICKLTQDFDKTLLDSVYHVDRNAKKGEFVEVKRPSFSFDNQRQGSKTLELPSDFPCLTKKLFSLMKDKREKFLNACFSYQFGLENWQHYPTISILSFVSAVESMMADEYSSGFCRDANRSCNLKKDVLKKFRLFFEQNLEKPLPKQLEGFLKRVYSKRSVFVHKSLLEIGEARGINLGFSYKNTKQLRAEQRYLESLVNAALMEWLKRI